MGQSDWQAYQYAGMRLNKNMYNHLNTLVFPALAILTREDIDLLTRHQISIQDEDVEELSILHFFNSAIMEIKECFYKVRFSNAIPLDDVREKVIPIIILMSQQKNFKHILTHLEQHDEYTYRHSIGVALISRLIGKSQRMSEEELLELTTAAFLHDIGKAKIPDVIINKPGKLTDEEYTQMKKHTVFGCEIIKNTLGISSRYALVALQHHEREDGSGYPHGIHGNEIDPYSKIVAVADIFHAMISKRTYKDPVPFYKVLQEMQQGAFGRLEPEITLSFIKKIMDILIGNKVVLSNGLEGKIIMVSPDDPLHPLIDVEGNYIKLSKDHDLMIERII